MSNPNHITRQQLAALIGAKSPSYINELAKTGRAFKAPCGKLWLKAESLAAWQASRNPAFQGVADRHAAARVGQGAEVGLVSTGSTTSTETAPEGPVIRYSEYNYQESKAKTEHFTAAREQAAYLKEAGELVEHSRMIAAFADAGSATRAKLESWQTTLPPELAGRDESSIRTILAEQVEAVLTDMVDIFSRMAATAAD